MKYWKTILGTTYQARGAVQYESGSRGTETSGHYLFWWRTERWSIINDQEYQDPEQDLPHNWIGMRMIVLEKL